MTVRTKLTVAYLGAGFAGWQRQPRQRTVQGELEHRLKTVVGGERLAIVGAGRTDAGVHATAQVAHVDLPAAIPLKILPEILNAGLGEDLRVRSAVRPPAGFHARISAVGKHYVYRMSWRPTGLPWTGLRTAVVPEPSRLDVVFEACRRLRGRHDWASFTVPEVAARPTVRNLYRVEPRHRRGGLEIHFLGEGFLRYQVRRMVGALLEIGHGRLTVSELGRLLDTPSPGAPLPTAEAKGLSLERVYYRSTPRLRSPSSIETAGEAPPLW